MEIEQIVALVKALSTTTTHTSLPVKVGDSVFIRTITMHYTGKVESISDKFIQLTDAAWVANSGRFTEALTTGSLSEVEPYPSGVAVAIHAIVDICPWDHKLPRDVC